MRLEKIAWRNIFRNKRRTLLTVSIMTIGIAVYIFGLGYVEGMRLSAFEVSAKNYGHIRIIDKDFEIKNKSLDLSANVSVEIKESLKNIEEIEHIVLKIGSAGIIFIEGDIEKKSLFFGIEEDSFKFLGMDEYIIEGNIYGEESILIGKELADKNNLKVGDNITLMTTTQYKSISALNFEISGIFNNSESIYNNSVMMSIDNAQYMLDMQDYVTEIAIYLHNIENLDPVFLKITDIISEKVEKWNEIGVNKVMISQFDISGKIFMIIFGGLASIGILNTMMMIVLERKREIGIMEANGLSKVEVFKLLFFEGVFMGVCGTLSGIILGSGITWYFSQYGLNFGESVKDIMNSYNMSYIIYPQVLAGNILDSVIIGIVFTSIGTIIPVLPQIKKKPSELIKE